MSLWNNLIAPHGMYKNTAFKPRCPTGLWLQRQLRQRRRHAHRGLRRRPTHLEDARRRRRRCPPSCASPTSVAAPSTASRSAPRGRAVRHPGHGDRAGCAWATRDGRSGQGLRVRDHGCEGAGLGGGAVASVGGCGRAGAMLSFVVLAWHSRNGVLVARFGWVAKGGRGHVCA